MSLLHEFGNIDIYLFDQLLKENINPEHKILDAGCGGGRNLIYFLQKGYDIYGIDSNPVAVASAKHMASQLAPSLNPHNFVEAKLENIPFEEFYFDWIICNAVLHFANDHKHFEEMLMGMWKHLKTGGVLFTRLASDIGMEARIKDLGNGRYFLADNSERYLISEAKLLSYTEKLGARLFEPIKTTNVQNLRAMTTWIIQKL